MTSAGRIPGLGVRDPRGLRVLWAIALAAAGWCGAIRPACAVRTMTWTEPSGSVPRGGADAIAFGPTGTILLGPRVEPLAEQDASEADLQKRIIPDPIVWSAGTDAQGNLYLGTGHSGRVVKVDAHGIATVLAELPEPEVTALVVARSGVVYAATSPHGAIYALPPAGEPSVFFEPDERYIWSLIEGTGGTLYAGTGETGKLFKISPKGDGSVLYDSPESHITALARDKDGALLAGSSGTGKIYRIGEDGQVRVLYDSNYREIASLAVDAAGQISAAAVAAGEGEVPAPAPRLVVRPGESEGPGLGPDETTLGQPDQSRAREQNPMQAEIEGMIPGAAPRRTREGGGAVFRIGTNGKVDDIWRSSEDVPFVLFVSPDGALLAGTGEPARLLRLEERGKALLLAQFPQGQLTSLLSAGSGGLVGVTNNASAAYTISREPASSGTYTSTVRDAGSGARWGRIRWEATVESGQTLEIQTRTGNGAVPDETWSGWSPPYNDPEGSPIVGPSARFVQWRARLAKPAHGFGSPALRSVTITYLQPNHPPRVRELKMLGWNETPSDDETGLDERPADATVHAQADQPGDRDGSIVETAGGTKDAGSNEPGRPKRIIVWHGEDPEGDRIVYSAYLQREGDSGWSLACKEAVESTCAFDETTWPEGRYRVKVVATDAPSNFPSEALEAEAIAEGALIDHTPPSLKKQGGSAGRIQVLATDHDSTIVSAEILVGDRVVAAARPVDGVLDSRAEMFEIEGFPDRAGSAPAAGAEKRRLRVRDSSGNSATADLD